MYIVFQCKSLDVPKIAFQKCKVYKAFSGIAENCVLRKIVFSGKSPLVSEA